MSPEDRAYLREFFQHLNDRPLEPDDEFYVHLYESNDLSDDDPVELLARGIEWTIGESVQLLSGYPDRARAPNCRRTNCGRACRSRKGARWSDWPFAVTFFTGSLRLRLIPHLSPTHWYAIMH